MREEELLQLMINERNDINNIKNDKSEGYLFN